MTSNWNKFVLLLWKNWIIQKRHYVQTIFEILIPVLSCSLLILVRSLVDPKVFQDPTVFKPLETNSISHLRTIIMFPAIELIIASSPKNPILDKIVLNAARSLGTDVRHRSYNDSTQLQNILVTHNYLAGIEFDDSLKDISELPDNITFAIRFPSEMRTTNAPGAEFWANWRTYLKFPPFQYAGARAIELDDGGYPANYFAEGFVAVQSAVSRAIIMERNGDPPDVFLNRFPYPPFYSDILLKGLENLLPTIIQIAFFYSCINTVKFITVEKEKQLKETMKIMGLPNWLHWTAWFVKCLLLLMISISLITILLCTNLTTNTKLAIFEFSDWRVVWLFLFIYSIPTITFCFMMSVFFSKANTAAGIAGLTWFMFKMPFNIVNAKYDTLTLSTKLALCIFSNSGMSFGFMLMMKHEGTSIGLHWDNVFSSVTIDDNLTVGHIMMMLLFDAFLYLMIALYFEKVLPSEFGIPEPWYFLATKKFWSNKIGYSAWNSDEDYEILQSATNVESEPKNKYPGVQIRGLRKVYNKNKVAVNGLSLNMFEDQITVLLGHNGAGKTTTMSMLCGIISPSSGTALINGCDIRTNLKGVRQSLGLCPQHNVLFNELTVAEHITFFSRLKGVQKVNITKEIQKYVELLELQDKENAQSHTLSGGMKRKLSIGVALCGDSKVVLCDEPTSGMDPAARRALWDLLQKEKTGRTILLSTHFMDEADILGDRIAIMAEGDLKAVGSPFFLKKKFGVGYRLTCVKGPNCDPSRLTSVLRKYIPTIGVETDIGTELSFILNEVYVSVFQSMLKDLEEHTEDCGITSYGISLTTLEEVFMKIGADPTVLDKCHKTSQNGNGLVLDDNQSQHSHSSLHLDEYTDLQTGFNLIVNQIKAMFLKKYLSTKRGWIQFLLQNFIPIFFGVMTILIVRNFPSNIGLPPLKMSLDSYKKTITVLEAQSNSSDIENYQNLFSNLKESQKLVTISTNFTEYVLKKAVEKIRDVDNEYMVGASITETNHTAWFNNKAYHTAPLALNMLFNSMLKSVCDRCDIEVINKPLPYQPKTRFLRLQGGNNMGFQLSFNTGFAMAFVAAFYIMFYIKERTSRAKLLQFVSGINVLTFWSVSFIWDFLTFIFTTILYVGVLAIFQEEGWRTPEELGRVMLIMLLFGFAVIPFTYLFSYFFDIPATGFVKMMMFNIFTGTIFFTAVFLMKYEGFNTVQVAKALEWVFMVFPLFALSHSLSNINIAVTTKQVCDAQCELYPFCSKKLMCKMFPYCCNTDIFTFDSNGISRNLVYMLGVGLISFALILFIEYRVIERIFKKRFMYFGPSLPETEDLVIDSDVKNEKNRVANMEKFEIDGNNLVVKNMTKFYKKFLAVNQLSFGVNHSECFGLLGVNGAGKTSTFKMLTGDVNISSGEAFVKGISLKSNMNMVHQHIGYCPQFDALLEDLTGRETLKIFALLRGIPGYKIEKASMKLAQDLNFIKHIDKKIKEYSGGNKRKLSTALALIGNPSVIYLDEPTTGMDPGAKRQFWNMMCKVRSAGKSIVLTSHSMEECEALCTRLAIMVNGEFKCIGSTQHLKNKFSKGFFLTIKIKKSGAIDRVYSIKNFIAQYFGASYLKEEYQDSLTYHITESNLRWSTMFGLMEEAKEKLDIEDYALGQTSLEQVFLFFTKYQRNSE